MKRTKINNNQKIVLLGMVLVFVMFLLYHFQFSPYAQCVNGYIKSYDHAIKSKSSKKYYQNQAKIVCQIKK